MCMCIHKSYKYRSTDYYSPPPIPFRPFVLRVGSQSSLWSLIHSCSVSPRVIPEPTPIPSWPSPTVAPHSLPALRCCVHCPCLPPTPLHHWLASAANHRIRMIRRFSSRICALLPDVPHLRLPVPTRASLPSVTLLSSLSRRLASVAPLPFLPLADQATPRDFPPSPKAYPARHQLRWIMAHRT
jgi:hypothetical protein